MDSTADPYAYLGVKAVQIHMHDDPAVSEQGAGHFHVCPRQGQRTIQALQQEGILLTYPVLVSDHPFTMANRR